MHSKYLVRRPHSHFSVLLMVMLLNGCYAISDPDIWPSDFVQKDLLPELVGSTEDVVLQRLGPPGYIVSKMDSTTFVYEKVEDDTAIYMMFYIPFPLPPHKGHETSCVLLSFDSKNVLQGYKIRTYGAAYEAGAGPICGCLDLFDIKIDTNVLKWCIYERIMNNENVKAIEVKEEFREYNARSQDDPTRLQWLCRAADHGYPHAQAEVGRHHWQALNNIQQDLARAYVWYSLSAKCSCLDSSAQLEKIAQDMSPLQASEATILLNQWKPGQCERELLLSDTIN